MQESAIGGVTADENVVAHAAENDAIELHTSEREESDAGIPAKRPKKSVENPKSTGT